MAKPTREPPRNDIEVYEHPEGQELPNEYCLCLLDIPPSGPPAVGDHICLLNAAMPPGDNKYVLDARYEVLARTHLWMPETKSDGSYGDKHFYSKTWITVRRLKTADIRAGKHQV